MKLILKRWLATILCKNAYWAAIVDRSLLVYRERGRKMTIAGEMVANGFVIYVASIQSWDDSKGELIDDEEKKRILSNVRTSLEGQGTKVYLD